MIYFSKDDPCGDNSNVNINYQCHLDKNTFHWGTNEHVQNLFPRGKAYWKLLNIQLEKQFNEISTLCDIADDEHCIFCNP